MIEWTKLDRLVISEKAYYHYCSYAYLRSGVIVQTSGFDPILFILAVFGFVIVFGVYGYFKGLLWFQQDSAKRSESLLASFNARDEASGGWFRRFGRVLVVLLFITLISYPVVTNLIVLSPFQLFIFIFVFHFPSELILLIILTVIYWRIRKQPVPEKGSPDQTDEPAH